MIAETECGLYRCGSSACLTSCETRDDCIPGAQCVSEACEPATAPVCIDDHTTLEPNGVASACGGYPCDVETGACATSCAADDDCVGEGTLCRGGQCIPAVKIRRVGLYDPEACSCRNVGAGSTGRTALACWLVAVLVLVRRSRRPRTASISLAGVVVVALLACGDPQEELPADEVCVDVGYSIANRTESCTDDPELASERWSHYEERFDCNVGKVTDEIRELYVCPVELLRMDCELFLDYGDDLDGLLSSIPECTRVVKRKDGTLLSPSELDAGVDAADADPQDGGAK
ncbi:MAG: hypothetical protein AB7K71_12560 [Polyangiaceae bacterium]